MFKKAAEAVYRAGKKGWHEQTAAVDISHDGTISNNYRLDALPCQQAEAGACEVDLENITTTKTFIVVHGHKDNSLASSRDRNWVKQTGPYPSPKSRPKGRVLGVVNHRTGVIRMYFGRRKIIAGDPAEDYPEVPGVGPLPVGIGKLE